MIHLIYLVNLNCINYLGVAPPKARLAQQSWAASGKALGYGSRHQVWWFLISENFKLFVIGESPSGKAAGFGLAIRGFESYLPRIKKLSFCWAFLFLRGG